MRMYTPVFTLIIAGCLGVGIAAPSPETANALKDLRAVSAEGQGHAPAVAAVKALSAGDVSNLLPILEAMDGANDYALNWLRSAFDSIASREIAAGKKLPTAELGKFVIETRHHPRARRLAFETLAQVDAATADQLLAGMLNDPSLEIRYDAVRKLVGQGNRAQEKGNQTGAALLWQQALSCSRDVKQIEDIAKKLEKVGQPVDLQKHFGFLTTWKVLGPFDNTGGKGFETVFAPEEKIDLSADLDGKTGKVRWKDYSTTHRYGMVDMNQCYGKLKEVTAYATTDFLSTEAKTVELRLGGKNSWKVWLNGKLLFGRDEYHNDAEIDQYPMPARLRAGRNTILVKVCQNEAVKEWTEEWEFQIRVTDALGTPIVSAEPSTAQASNN